MGGFMTGALQQITQRVRNLYVVVGMSAALRERHDVIDVPFMGRVDRHRTDTANSAVAREHKHWIDVLHECTACHGTSGERVRALADADSCDMLQSPGPLLEPQRRSMCDVVFIRSCILALAVRDMIPTTAFQHRRLEC